LCIAKHSWRGEHLKGTFKSKVSRLLKSFYRIFFKKRKIYFLNAQICSIKKIKAIHFFQSFFPHHQF
jgi:hypothetical protein